MEPTLIKNNKIFSNQKKIIITLIVFLVCLFIGTSYSILTSTDETEEVITFQAGDLNLEVKTNNDATVDLQDELPKTEDEVEKPIILNLRNIGSLTICEYRLKLVEDTEFASDLETNYIRYAVSEDNGVTYKESKLLSETNNQIYVGFDLKPETTKTIYVKVWLDKSSLDSEEVLNKHFYGKIDAELLQRCETFGTKILKETVGKDGGIIGVTNDNQKVATDSSNIREYRYSGPIVNNYVTFNNELWRIIGIFKDEEGQENIKIVRNEILPVDTLPDTYALGEKTYKIRYNSSTRAYWDYDGSTWDNNWADAGLMNWLNSLGTEDGYLKKLTNEAQNMVYEKRWNLGNEVYNDSPILAYVHERGTVVCSESCNGGDVWSGNSATWVGKIGLMYPSDMGFSTDSNYWNIAMNTWNNTQLNTTWLKEGHTDYEWFVSPSFYINGVNLWFMDGFVSNYDAFSAFSVRPALYLKSDVIITSGNGTVDQPYQLKFNL